MAIGDRYATLLDLWKELVAFVLICMGVLYVVMVRKARDAPSDVIGLRLAAREAGERQRVGGAVVPGLAKVCWGWS